MFPANAVPPTRHRFYALVLAMVGLFATAGADAATAPVCGGAYHNPVVTENCSSPSTSWSQSWRADRTHYQYDPTTFAGYASATSVNAGGTVQFYVHSSSDYRIDIYRLGYYGGAGARLMQSVSSVSKIAQPACAWVAGGTPEQYYSCASWKVSYSLAVPSSWVSGIYIAALTTTSSTTGSATTGSATTGTSATLPYQAHITFVVRNDGRSAQLYYQQAIATDQAYNNAYGPGLYVQTDYKGTRIPIAKASFDRPYDALDNLQLYRFEAPFIYFMESQGYDVTYGTDVDTHEGTARPAAYQGFLVAGHSEYWTKQMYDDVVAARDAGVNLGFFSGNTLYTQMRLEDSAAPVGDSSHATRDRIMVVYRYAYPRQANGLGDPNPDPALQTIRWRGFPVRRDQQALVGLHYTSYQNCSPHTAAWASAGRPATGTLPQVTPAVIVDPQPLIVAAPAHWIYSGTGLSAGSAVPFVYGQEADAYEPLVSPVCGVQSPDPPPVLPAHRAGSFAVLADSPFLHVTGMPGALVSVPTYVHVNATTYQACSGAYVFAGGSIMWANALAPANIAGRNYTQPAIQRMTQNVLDAYTQRQTPPPNTGACITPHQDLMAPIVPLLLDDAATTNP